MKKIVIKRRRGSRPFKHGQHTLVARVDLGFVDGGEYRHPEVEIGFVSSFAGTPDRFERIAAIRFQRHRARGKPGARGFVATPGWSGAYAAEIRFCAEYASQRKAGARVLELLGRIDDAHAAMYAARRDRLSTERYHRDLDCDLLKLVLGLRYVGVEVTVSRPERERSQVSGGYGSLAVAS